jgi:hypothetical protein
LPLQSRLITIAPPSTPQWRGYTRKVAALNHVGLWLVPSTLAAEVYAKRQHLGEEAINYAWELKIEAARKLYAIWKDSKKNKGTLRRGGKSPRGMCSGWAIMTSELRR